MGEDSIRGLKQATLTANLASSVGFDQKFLNQTCFRYLSSVANSNLQDSEPLENLQFGLQLLEVATNSVVKGILWGTFPDVLLNFLFRLQNRLLCTNKKLQKPIESAVRVFTVLVNTCPLS